MDKIQYSLGLLQDFFNKRDIDFWLEAGTALAAYRDGEIFPWEHDIDVAIWRNSVPEPREFLDFFSREGYEVIIQKDYPFLDNIIQLKAKPEYREQLFDLDIYLYTRKQGHAYMRWIQKPEGRLGGIKKQSLTILKCLVNPKSKKWKALSSFFPKSFTRKMFQVALKYHIRFSSCIYHRFPEAYFLNLKKIAFYGFQINIPADTDNFLVHRYGGGWKEPDKEFNQAGKWKKSAARVELPMALLPVPQFDDRVVLENE